MNLESWLTTTLSITSIGLAIVGVALTVLGVVFAVVALWGFVGLKTWAEQRAQEAANKKLTELLAGDEIKEYIQAELASQIANIGNQLLSDHSISQSYRGRLDYPPFPADLGMPVYPEDTEEPDAD
jgi:hypothetical protein